MCGGGGGGGQQQQAAAPAKQPDPTPMPSAPLSGTGAAPNSVVAQPTLLGSSSPTSSVSAPVNRASTILTGNRGDLSNPAVRSGKDLLGK